MDLSTELKTKAIEKGLCEEWQKNWCESDRDSLIQFYLRGIFWCMKESYPPIALMQDKFGDMLEENNIFLYGTKILINENRIVIKGDTAFNGFYDNKSVGVIYAGDDSDVSITVTDGSIITVHLFQNAKISITCAENSKVYVYQRGGVITQNSGNVQIIDKRTE